jgi:uncharacterized RDD family membrane protein YckC
VPNLPSLEIGDSAQRLKGDPFDPDICPWFYHGITLRRIIAYLVDVIVIAAATSVAGIGFAVLGVLSFGLLSPLLAVLLLIVPLAYHTLLIGGPGAATLGMRLFGIEVRRIDGAPPGYPLAALQTIVFYVTVAFTSWLVLLVALFNERGRTLHDYLCGTVVVNGTRRIEALRH